jgi:cytochrome c-type biogenesis protein CcmH/NrfG
MSEQLAMLARAADDAGNYDEAYAYWTRVLEADPLSGPLKLAHKHG